MLFYAYQQAGTFSIKPRGIDGITILVEHHDALEHNLVQLIKILNPTKVGPWICTGWDKCIRKDHEQKQLKEHYQFLSENGIKMTKTAAKAQLGS